MEGEGVVEVLTQADDCFYCFINVFVCINIYLVQESRDRFLSRRFVTRLFWGLTVIPVQPQQGSGCGSRVLHHVGQVFTAPRTDNAFAPLPVTYETNAVRNIYVIRSSLLDQTEQNQAGSNGFEATETPCN